MQNLQKILIAGLVIMVLLNIGTLSYIIFRPKHPHFGKHRFGMRHKPEDRLLEELNLNAQQREKIEHLNISFEFQLEAYRSQSDSIRKLQIEQLQNEKPDYAMVQKNSAAIGKCFEEMDRLKFKHFDELKLILTSEQKTKFYELLKTSGPFGKQPFHGGFMPGRGPRPECFHGRMNKCHNRHFDVGMPSPYDEHKAPHHNPDFQ